MWKATIRGLLGPEGPPGPDRAGHPARRQLRQRHLRAHRHGQAVVRRRVRPDPVGVDLQVQGASALGDVSNPGGSPTPPSTRCGPSRVCRGPRGSCRPRWPVRRRQGRRHRRRWAAHDRRLVGRRRPVPADRTAGPPPGPREVAMDAGTAAKHGFAVGDRVRVLLERRGQAVPDRRPVRLRGHHRLRRGHLRRVRPRDRPARVRRRRRPIDAVYVQREPGVPTAVLQAAHRAPRSGPPTRCSPPTQATLAGGQAGPPVPRVLHRRAARLRRDRGGGRRLHHLQHVHDPRGPTHPRARAPARDGRDRRAGRAVGGARGVRWSAAVASVLGLVAGVGLGVGLLELLREHRPRPPRHHHGARRPARWWCRSRSGSSSRWSAALLPAVRAARVPPVAAIADVRAPGGGWVPPPGDRRGWSSSRSGSRCSSYGLARARDVTGLIDQVQVVAIGAFGVLVGVVMVLPAVARPAVRAIGAPLRRLGPPGVAGARERDAQPAAHRHHRVGAGDRARARRAHRDVRRVGAGFGGPRHRRGAARRLRGEGRRLRRVLDRRRATASRRCPACRPGVPMRFADGSVGGDVETVGSLDPDAARAGRRPRVRERGPRRPQPGRTGCWWPTTSRRHLGVTTGDTTARAVLDAGSCRSTVRGVYRNQNFIGIFGQSVPMMVSPDTLERRRPAASPRTRSSSCGRAGGASARRRNAALVQELATDFPNISVLTRVTSSVTTSRPRSTSSSPC